MKFFHRFALVTGLLTSLAVTACSYSAKPEKTAEASVSNTLAANEIAFTQLPPEAQDVIGRIKNRGSFKYAQDGKTFQNREKRLPEQPRGYYQEYTVVTPNANNRGARRIVVGKGKTGDVATAAEFYYTSDHYRHFYRVKE